MRKLITLVFILAMAITCRPQISFYKQYTVNEGLASSVVYDIAQDSTGYLWIATDHGVSRYDGYSFQNFNTHNGLAANSNVLIFAGAENRMWFLSYSGLLSYTSENRVKVFAGNDSLSMLGGKYHPRSIVVDENDHIWVSMHRDTTRSIRMEINGNIRIIDTSLDSRSQYSYLFRDYYAGNDPCPCRHGQDSQVRTSKNIYRIGKGYYSLDAGDNLFYEGSFIPPGSHPELRTFDVHCEENGTIWLRKQWDGVYLYHCEKISAEPLRLLPDMRVTKILKDRDLNYWIATEGNGLFFIPSVDFYVYNQAQGIPNANIISLETAENKLFFATNDGKLYSSLLSENAQLDQRKELLPRESFKYCRDILFGPRRELWVVSTKYLRYSENGRPLPLRQRVRKKTYEFCETSDGRVLAAMIEGFCMYYKNSLEYDSRSDGFAGHVRTICAGADGTIWLGTMNGLYTYNGTAYTYWGDSSDILAGRITRIREIDGKIWAGTRSDGLAVISKDSIMILNESRGLSSNMIKSIHEHRGQAWVGTINGLNRVAWDEQSRLSISGYSVWDGLPSNEINDLSSYGDYLIVASNFGLCTFNPEMIRQRSAPPPLIFNSIAANNHTIEYIPGMQLSDSVNSILINYTGIQFSDPGNVNYRYKIRWHDKNHSPLNTRFSTSDDWVNTRNTSLRINVIPGEYEILFQASGKSGSWSPEPLRINFSVAKPVIQKLWFHILLFILLIIILVFIFILILRSRKRKEQIRTSMILSEQKALRAQMNPHFIFNALNSIQNFILEKDDEKTDLYLASFSGLMRKVLENSKHNLIPLAEELETLEMYLNIEHMRFEHRFSYTIRVDNEIDTGAVMIPPSLVQPYLENAIWHGLMPLETAGKLLLKVDVTADHSLQIIIEDNGIGRQAASKLKKKHSYHKSTGMKNIEERIELLNRTSKGGFGLSVEDLFDKEGKASGTRIELLIPLDITFKW